jgi:hypothetical protein
MGMLYAVTFAAVATTAQVDFFEYVAPSDAVGIIHSVQLSQSSDQGDATAEGLAILHKRGATVSGSGGSTATPAALEGGSPAAGGTAETNNTTKANTGTIVTLEAANWVIQQTYLWLPTPECRHIVSPGIRYTVELGTTPADSLTISGTMIVEEFGG